MNIKSIIQYIVDHPEFISAAAAFLSFGFAMFVYYRTRMLLKPMERPMFCVIKQSAEASLVEEPCAGIRIIMKSKVKNIGKHTADNLDVWAAIIPEGELKTTRLKHFGSSVNRIGYNYEFNITIDHEIHKIEDGKTVHISKDTVFIIYVLLRYANAFRRRKKYYDEFWFGCQDRSLSFADKDTRATYERCLDKDLKKVLKSPLMKGKVQPK